MAWIYLDDQFPDHPKVVAAGGDAGWLFVCGLAYVKRYATEGTIPKNQVTRLSDRKAPTRLARRLVDAGLWHDEGDSYRIHDYEQWNKPQQSRSAAARKAAQSRWAKDAKRNAKADANALPDASGTHGERMPDADASTCPPPQPPTDVLTSSDYSHSAADPPDEEESKPKRDPLIETALAILAQRDLDARIARSDRAGPVGDVVAWRNGAIDKRRPRDSGALADLAGLHPGASPAELADLLEPPSSTMTADDVTGEQQAFMARAERHLRVISGEACQACNDTGLTLDEDGNAVPCGHPDRPA